MPDFQLVSPFSPEGDQPEAIRQLVEGIRAGVDHQVLLGVTGSGKTFNRVRIAGGWRVGCERVRRALTR